MTAISVRAPFTGPLRNLPLISTADRLADETIYVVANDLSNELGYTNGSLRDSISRWVESGDLIEGRHVQMWTGAPLDELRVCDRVGKQANAARVLTEQGVYIVLMLSDKPLARSMRHEWALQIEALRRLAEKEVEDGVARRLDGLSAEIRRIALRPAGVPTVPSPKYTPRIPVLADPEALLASWARVFGSQSISPTDAWKQARKASWSEPIKALADAAKNPNAFGCRLRGLVRRDAPRLDRTTSGDTRFYKLIDS